ncbi:MULTISPECIES: hypothetical protein [unclassified Agrococcus]|uniref:hypothetical protein n=1 Tax=unclassified Agrococcus TaxID=2615065 RepID=UPI00360F07C2
MREALRDPRALAAVPWLVAAIAAGAMATTVMAVDAWWQAAPLVSVLLAGIVVGLGLLVAAAAPRPSAARPLALLGALALLAVPIAAAMQTFAFAFGPLVLILPVAVLVLASVLLALRGTSRRRPAVGAVAGAALVALAVTAVGVLDGLVWMPMTLAPGIPLDVIYAELERQGEDGGIPMVVAWGVVATLGVVVAGAAALRRRHGAAAAAALTLAPAVSALLVLQWWEFAMGMSVSDALPPYAGGQSDAMPWIGALTAALAGLVAWLALRSSAARVGAPASTMPTHQHP